MTTANNNPTALGADAAEQRMFEKDMEAFVDKYEQAVTTATEKAEGDAPPELIYINPDWEDSTEYFLRPNERSLEYMLKSAHLKEVAAKQAMAEHWFREAQWERQQKEAAVAATTRSQATHDAEVATLREALRGLTCATCRRKISSPPAPEIMECPHCAAARNAMRDEK